MIDTELTRSWGLRYPLIQAPMAGVAGGALAAAVSAAGGLGMLGVGSTTTAEWIEAEAAHAGAAGRFGIGLMAWALARRPELLENVLAVHPYAVSISFGDPAAYVRRVQAAGVRVLCMVQDLESARQAQAAGADALIAQGTDAGGHTGTVGTLPLLQQVLELGEAAGLPVLAAGGIGSGRGIAGVLAMGAAGVWLGTRFAATQEALGSTAAKERLIGADATKTVHTRVFDIVQEIPWPAQFPGRALANSFTERWHGREQDLQAHLHAEQARFRAAQQDADLTELHIYAGQAVGLVHDAPPAAALVERLMGETEDALRHAASLIR